MLSLAIISKLTRMRLVFAHEVNAREICVTTIDEPIQEADLSHKSKHLASEGELEELSRSSSTAKYMGKRHARGRRHALAAVGISLAVLLVIAIGTGIAFINNINKRLSNGVSQETLNTLTEVKFGEPFYMLLLGIDKSEHRAKSDQYGEADSNYRSDSIMIARIDPTQKKVTLISIHRDTMVDMGEYGTEKINAAFAFGGAPYAITFIGDFAGINISHYAEIDMDGMAAVIDEVGGIDVDLPIDVSDPYYTKLDLKAGKQHLNGKQATLLCRARHAYDKYGDGDLYRAANQRMVIKAVIEKILKSDPTTMASSISAMADMITTDLDATEIMGLATQMVGLDVSKDVMTGMEPTTSLYTNDTWYEICDTEAWQKMMTRVDQGLSPYDGESYDETQGVAASIPGESQDTSKQPATNASGSDTSDNGDTADNGSSSGTDDSDGLADEGDTADYGENDDGY